MQEIIQDIRRKCRLAMNGIASTSMRQRGLSYKINFGLQISQIKELASGYTPSAELADLLWKEDNTRELKILATLLYPISEFTKEDARKWVSEVSNQEIREQVSLNLFQNLPFARELVDEWGRSEDPSVRVTGYWLLVRLFLTKKITQTNIEMFSFVWDDVISEDIFLRNSASSALKHIGRQSLDTAKGILSKLEKYKDSDDLINQEAYNSLAFEFEFYFEED